MEIVIEGINHVALVVRDRSAAERFYVDVLGLQRHHTADAWLVLNARNTLHLIPLPQAEPEGSLRHRFQHFALQVSALDAILALLLRHGLTPFQADFQGNTRAVTAPDDPLDFGTGSLFVRDPDGNLVEFLQMGRGLFGEDNLP